VTQTRDHKSVCALADTKLWDANCTLD